MRQRGNVSPDASTIGASTSKTAPLGALVGWSQAAGGIVADMMTNLEHKRTLQTTAHKKGRARALNPLSFRGKGQGALGPVVCNVETEPTHIKRFMVGVCRPRAYGLSSSRTLNSTQKPLPVRDPQTISGLCPIEDQPPDNACRGA